MTVERIPSSQPDWYFKQVLAAICDAAEAAGKNRRQLAGKAERARALLDGIKVPGATRLLRAIERLDDVLLLRLVATINGRTPPNGLNKPPFGRTKAGPLAWLRPPPPPWLYWEHHQQFFGPPTREQIEAEEAEQRFREAEAARKLAEQDKQRKAAERQLWEKRNAALVRSIELALAMEKERGSPLTVRELQALDINLTVWVRCQTCRGTGVIADDTWCDHCGGEGSVFKRAPIEKWVTS